MQVTPTLAATTSWWRAQLKRKSQILSEERADVQCLARGIDFQNQQCKLVATPACKDSFESRRRFLETAGRLNHEFIAGRVSQTSR